MQGCSGSQMRHQWMLFLFRYHLMVPSVNLKFMNILGWKQKDAEMISLISVGTYELHIIHCAFQHGKESSKWRMKKLFASMLKIFHEPPLRRADFENVIGCGENDYPLQFCAHQWIGNEVVVRRAQVVWPKIVEVVRHWQSLQKG